MSAVDTEPIRPCQGCKRPTRPNGWSPEEYPGTVTYGGYGYCTNCRRAQVKEEQAKMFGEPQADRPTTEQNKASLLAYFKERRPYREALGQTHFPDPLNPWPTPACGTPAGYKHHVKRKEKICEPCRKARSEQRPTRRTRELKPCGTYAAWMRHNRKGEEKDLACENAYTLHKAEQRERARERRTKPHDRVR